MFFGDSITSCSGVSKNYSTGFLSFRLPLINALQRALLTTTTRRRTKGGLSDGEAAARSFITVGPQKGCNRKLDQNINSAKLFGGAEFMMSDSFFGRNLVEAVRDDLRKSIEKHRPDLLVFSLGVNDVIRGAKASTLLPHYESALKMITIAQLPLGAVLMSPTRLDVDRPKSVRRFRKASQRLDETIAAVRKEFFNDCAVTSPSFVSSCPLSGAAKFPSRGNIHFLSLIDFAPRPMTYDGIHPNRIGEQFICDKLFPLLRRLMWPASNDSVLNNEETTAGAAATMKNAHFKKNIKQTASAMQQQQQSSPSARATQQLVVQPASSLLGVEYVIVILVLVVATALALRWKKRSFFG